MKLLLVWFSILLWLISSSNAMSSEVAFKPDLLCNPDFVWHPGNLKSVHEIDVNADSVSELLLFIQYNNNARFHLFYDSECGFKEVTDNRDNPIDFLSYASSIACQPIGCLNLTYCEEKDGLRYLVTVIGRHTLTLEEKHKWMDGDLPDKNVTSQVLITKYRLVDGQLIQSDSQVITDALSNLDLFDRSSNDIADINGWGFEISSCS